MRAPADSARARNSRSPSTAPGRRRHSSSGTTTRRWRGPPIDRSMPGSPASMLTACTSDVRNRRHWAQRRLASSSSPIAHELRNASTHTSPAIIP